MQSETEQSLRVLYREAFARRKWIIGAFMALTAIALVVGVNWPKVYRSSSTILVEDQRIVEPLVRGAGRGEGSERVSNAQEIIYGRSMMLKVLESGGWLADNPTPMEVEARIEELRENTAVLQVGENLIKIEFEGSDPERVYATTEKLAGLFIEETLAERAKESDTAFKFIDEQAKQYERKLQESEQRLNALRQEHPEARPGAREESDARIAQLRADIGTAEQALRETRIRRTSLQKQLAGEGVTASMSSQAEQYRVRIAQLRQQLDTLRMTYHDAYPDVVQLKYQISELEKAVAQEAKRPRGQQQPGTRVDDAMRGSPVYQELQTALYDATTGIQTLEARIGSAQKKLDQELALAQRIRDVGSELQELTRDSEVNQAIYQDLTRRRENARVSMNLNVEQQGLSLRVVEPAYFSHSPAGPRLVHFAFGGLVVAAALPLGLLFGLLLIDPRVRTGTPITHELGLPLLGSIPRLDTPQEAQAERRGLFVSGVLVLLTVMAVIVVLVLRLQGVI